jgi:hypothetical protein
VEIEPDSSHYTAEGNHNYETKKLQPPMLESMDIVIRDLKIVYSSENYWTLIQENSEKNFVLLEKFSIGLQYQTLMLEDDT